MTPASSGRFPFRRSAYRALPGTVWALGLTSLLMDASSELVHSLLPVFMASVLGASMLTIGVIEGVAEATAAVTKVFSGAVSDYLRSRKPLVVLGYGLAAVAKPVFPLATSITWVFVARFTDRIGKGIRGAPRDALVADITPPDMRGAAYGLRQSLDSIGAFVGPLFAIVLMSLWEQDVRAVLWAGVLPAVLAVALLVLAVREPAPSDGRESVRLFGSADLETLTPRYWLVVAIGAVLTLARFSDAFLVLRASSVGLPIGLVPGVMIVMNVVYAGSAYPAGVAADRWNPGTLLIWGIGILILADLVLAAATSPAHAFLGAALWGLHMGLTQGLLSKLVADEVAPRIRGTAFGIFNLVSGVVLLLASVIAGALWTVVGPSATFLAGATFALTAVAGLAAYRSTHRA